MHPKQSWPSAFVDIAIITSVVALCFVPSVSPMAWSVLGQIALVRFGVAVTKQAFGNASSGSSPGSDRDPPAPSAPTREPRKRQDTPPSDTLRRSVLAYAMIPIIVAAATIASAIH